VRYNLHYEISPFRSTTVFAYFDLCKHYQTLASHHKEAICLLEVFSISLKPLSQVLWNHTLLSVNAGLVFLIHNDWDQKTFWLQTFSNFGTFVYRGWNILGLFHLFLYMWPEDSIIQFVYCTSILTVTYHMSQYYTFSYSVNIMSINSFNM
jgi:hypothetical protein